MKNDVDPALTAYEMANRSRNEGELQTAVRQYAEAIELGYSGTNEALYYRGVCLLELGYNDKAVVDLEECAERGGINDAYLNINLGACLHRLGRHEEALEEYKAGLDRNEDDRNGLLHNNIGCLYDEMGHATEAISAFSKALKCKHYGCSDDLGRLISEAEQLDKSILRLESYISSLGDELPASALADLYYWVATCLFNIENSKENPNYNNAIKAFDIAVTDQSNLSRSLYGRGMANLYADNFEAAIQDFTDVIEAEREANSERDPNAYYHRAKALAGTGKYLLALSDIDIALKLNDQEGSFYFLKGCLQIKVDTEEQACKAWKAANELGHKEAEEFFEHYGCSRVLDKGKDSEDLISRVSSCPDDLHEEKSGQLKAFIASIIEDDELQDILERASSVISVVRIAKRYGFTITPSELLAASPISFFVTNKEGIKHFTIDVS